MSPNAPVVIRSKKIGLLNLFRKIKAEFGGIFDACPAEAERRYHMKHPNVRAEKYKPLCSCSMKKIEHKSECRFARCNEW